MTDRDSKGRFIKGHKPYIPPTVKYTDPDVLQDAIDSYFETVDDKPTLTGLMYHLGFADKQSFHDIANNDVSPLSATIKRAKLRVESHYERMLQGTTPAGSIFALKQHGWSDKVDVGGDNNIVLKVVYDE